MTARERYTRLARAIMGCDVLVSDMNVGNIARAFAPIALLAELEGDSDIMLACHRISDGLVGAPPSRRSEPCEN